MNEKSNIEQPPFCVQLTRGQRGNYGWVIHIEGKDAKTVLTQIDQADSRMRERYLGQKPAPALVTESTSPSPAAAAPQNLSNIFPRDLADLLTFEEKPDIVIIRLRQFLGSEAFAKIAAIVKEQGGEYISAGKESYFRLPKPR